jgi:hypothetical protein
LAAWLAARLGLSKIADFTEADTGSHTILAIPITSNQPTTRHNVTTHRQLRFITIANQRMRRATTVVDTDVAATVVGSQDHTNPLAHL